MTNKTENTFSALKSNDLEELAELATLVVAAKDALTDDMVSRMASAFSEGIALLDRLTRNEGLIHLLQELDRPENQQFLISLSNAFTKASREISTVAPAKGGLIEIIRLARNPGTQEGLRLVSLIGKNLSDNMRQMHRSGGGN